MLKKEKGVEKEGKNACLDLEMMGMYIDLNVLEMKIAGAGRGMRGLDKSLLTGEGN